MTQSLKKVRKDMRDLYYENFKTPKRLKTSEDRDFLFSQIGQINVATITVLLNIVYR